MAWGFWTTYSTSHYQQLTSQRRLLQLHQQQAQLQQQLQQQQQQQQAGEVPVSAVAKRDRSRERAGNKNILRVLFQQCTVSTYCILKHISVERERLLKSSSSGSVHNNEGGSVGSTATGSGGAGSGGGGFYRRGSSAQVSLHPYTAPDEKTIFQQRVYFPFSGGKPC